MPFEKIVVFWEFKGVTSGILKNPKIIWNHQTVIFDISKVLQHDRIPLNESFTVVVLV